MTTIAIISEGITDQVFLEELIFKCINFRDEPEFVYAQPMYDATHKHTAPHGGWELVLEFCEKRILEALGANDYAIIQIDTDCGDHPNFGLELCPGGIDKDDETLVQEAVEIIKSKIGPQTIQHYGDKIIFAICVHSLETWILMCVGNIKKKKNSFNHICRSGLVDKFQKNASCYRQLASMLTTKKIGAHATGSESLALFISDFLEKVDGSSSAIL